MPILFESPYTSIGQGIRSAGSALSQALQQSAQQVGEKRGLSAFQQAMEDSEDPNDITKAYTEAIRRGADPKQLQFLSESHQKSRKQNAFKSAYEDSIKVGGFNTKEGRDAFIKKYANEGGDPFEAMKFFSKDTKGQTVFDKKIDEFKAQSVIDYMQGGDQSQVVFNKSLDYLEKNIPNVGRAKALTGGQIGVVGGGEYGPLPSKEFTEYERVGNLVLDGVIKIYNKSGVLPKQKLDWIRKTFSVSPFDTQEQIKGKISALRSIAKDTSEFQEQMGNLINQYGNDIPNDKFMQIQSKLNNSFNKYESSFQSPQDEQVYNKLPTKGIKKGSMATNTETGQKYIWNGSKWTKKR